MRSGTHDAIDIEGLEISETVRTPGQYTFIANLIDGVPRPCCDSPTLTRWNSPERRFRDVKQNENFVEVVCYPQRYMCSSCKRTVCEEVPGLHDEHRMTARLVDYINKEAGRRTFAKIAREVGISESTARLVFIKQMVSRMKAHAFDLPRVLGIDEKYIFGTYFVVIGDIEERKYLDIIGTRDTKVLKAYFLNRTDRDRVEVITSDMEKKYQNVAEKFFPRASVVIDKYHVLEMANGAVDRLRFSIGKTKKKAERSWYRQNRKILLKRKF